MCYQYNLRLMCMSFGAGYFGIHVAGLIYVKNPDFLTIVLLTLAMVIGLALFLGALFENAIIVLVALILELFEFLYAVIVVVGVIFDLGDFTENVIFGSVRIVLHLLVIYVMYAYNKELRNSEDN